MIKKDFYKKLDAWLETRSLKERIFMLMIGFILIYFFIHAIFGGHSSQDQKQIEAQIQVLKKNITLLQEQSDLILKAVTNREFTGSLQQQKKLTAESEKIQQKMSKAGPLIMNENDISNLTHDIFNAQGNVIVGDIKNLPDEEWAPSGIDSASIPASLKNVHRRVFQMDFNSDYLNTINFLKRLEKLPWHIYWESMSYTVSQYPDAAISIKFYVLSKKT